MYEEIEDCVKKFCQSLREYTIKIISFETKRSDTINKRTTGTKVSMKKLKYATFAKKFAHEHINDKMIVKLNCCHYTVKYSCVALSKCYLISEVFHNGSNYDYHFIIKELAKEFEGEFNCEGENTEKYKIFSVPVQK